MTTPEINYEAIIERLRQPNGDITALLTNAADAIEQLLQENEDLLDVSAVALGAIMRKVAELERDNQRLSEEIQNFTTSDVVKVVHCRDCKHKINFQNRIMCDRNARYSTVRSEWYGLTATDNDNFCSYGERKEGQSESL